MTTPARYYVRYLGSDPTRSSAGTASSLEQAWAALRGADDLRQIDPACRTEEGQYLPADYQPLPGRRQVAGYLHHHTDPTVSWVIEAQETLR